MSLKLLSREMKVEKITIIKDAVILYRDIFARDELEYLFSSLKDNIIWTQEYVNIANKKIAQPRLSAWYGDEDAHYTYSNLKLQPRLWNETLLLIKQKIEELSLWQFNSVLLNYYRDGNDSIAWHSDDERQLGYYPKIASFSLGETRKFLIKPKKKSAGHLKIFLRAGDLLLLYGEFQRNWLHALPKHKSVKNPRINLTFRRIYITQNESK